MLVNNYNCSSTHFKFISFTGKVEPPYALILHLKCLFLKYTVSRYFCGRYKLQLVMRHAFYFHRRKVLEACRGFKHLFNEARERASKALGFTKKLMNDLENAAKFSMDVPMHELLMRLEASGHIQVSVFAK